MADNWTSYRGVTVERIFPSGMHRIYVMPFPIITDGDPRELIDDIRAGRYDGEHYVPDTDEYPDDEIAARLAYLRDELRAERISQGELIELQNLAEHIRPGDVELLEAAGVPEHADDDAVYVVTFDTREINGPRAVAHLRHMSLDEARKLRDFAAATHTGRIVNVETLDVVD